MKTLTIRFEDSVDINQLPKGTPVSVSDGTIIANGIVMILADIEELPVQPHVHPTAVTSEINVAVGPSQEV